METGFADKNGRKILVGDTIKYTDDIIVGERLSGKGRNRASFAITEKKEIIGVIKFGLYKHTLNTYIITFFIETPQETVYDTYFWGDKPKRQISNLSTALTDKIAAKCTILVTEKERGHREKGEQ